MIEAGKYRAKAREWALGDASTGTKQIGISFDLLDHAPESITYYGFFTDAALEYTIANMRLCGWQGADLSDLSGLDAREVVLVIEHERDPQGQIRAKVKYINGAGGLAMKTALDANGTKSFAAQMKAKILALDPSSAAKHAAVRKPAADDAPPHNDADGPPF